MKKIILLTVSTILILLKTSFGQDSLYYRSAVYANNIALRAITSGDVFNNGHSTIIIGDENYHLLFLNWENEILTILDTLVVPCAITWQIDVKDVNNDRYNELIVSGFNTSQDTGSSIIYKYNQNFVTEWDTTGFYYPTFVIGDIDNDQNNEIALCDYGENQNTKLMVLSYQNRVYHLDFSQILLDPYNYSSFHHPIIADFNGDGNNELAVANNSAYTLLFGFDGSTYTQLNSLGPCTGGALRVSAGNVDDDPAEELLNGTNSGLIEVLSYSSNWNFVQDWGTDIGRLAYRFAVNNIDQDIESEFAVIHSNTDSYYNGQVSVFDHVSGNFEMIWNDTLGNGWREVHLSDIDQDNSVELLVLVNDSLIIYETQTTTVGIKDNYSNIPKEFLLKQNYPNPFNPVTKIRYNVPQNSKVKINVYDLAGHRVKILVNEYKT
ncbi:MAG: hypothetical protein P8078_03240, partial [bacterium]